ncbi:carbamoyltransferase HypF [Kyrpidia spormannii]|uniref:Carbamoyltransferase n=1 Tax=Kyrpidia spormannii TaxID=2055160 RepID=A0A2K8N5R1_9BACL|nr:carbamoyltransferase HypF [Kyrpidia spormannii]ATY84666.1 carbamoyltransferase HypF [Kyrpidia spormannii]
MTERVRVTVAGTVQGVGFRPFVYRLASEIGLTGEVCNRGSIVTVDVEGCGGDLAQFLRRLQSEAPPAARIDDLGVERLRPVGYQDLKIVSSEDGDRVSFGIPADLAICPDCLRDMAEPTSRYYRYPFTSCTQCGPRYTVSKRLPFDRETTVMEDFPLCPECLRDYRDPGSRRFHAQTTACPRCGPVLRWIPGEGGEGEKTGEDALKAAKDVLRSGGVVAVLGIGGFHLAVNALNEQAVRRLRVKKHRPTKPFAVMMSSEAVKVHCVPSAGEWQALTSAVRPIVLLQKRPDSPVAGEVAPGMDRLGVFLPYTGIQVLLMEDADLSALVMTSGNLSGEPLAYEVEDGLRRLAGLAEGFLVHNRPILRPVDDSVLYVDGDVPRVIRRGRGMVPEGFRIGRRDEAAPVVLAVGGDLKNAVAVAAKGKLWLSPHIGDLDSPRAREGFRRQIEWQLETLGVAPDVVAHDLHPGYVSTAEALGNWEKTLGVQHHHAHLAAVITEHRATGPVLGVILDGTGYGEDGGIWGGEMLLGDCRSVLRIGHLEPLRMVVGDQGTREPWRLVVNYFYALDLWDRWADFVVDRLGIPARSLEALIRVLKSRYPGYRSSSAGRLFDVVGALVSRRTEATFEGELPMGLEAQVDPGVKERYNFHITERDGRWMVSPGILDAVCWDLAAGRQDRVATKFHRGFAAAWAEAAFRAATRHGVSTVAVGGGVWQNRWLLRWFVEDLENRGLRVLIPRRWPAGDGGLAAGQAAVALAKLREGGG